MPRIREVVLVAITGIVLSACGGDGSGPDDGGDPTAIAIASGDGQTARVATALAQPIIVRVTGNGARPVSGVAVAFQVTIGGGSVSSASVLTGADGTAQTVWTLGRSVAEQHRLQARVGTGATSLTANFTATATPGDAASVTVASGNSQTRPPGSALSDSLAALVNDAYGNAVPGVTVTWSVTGGGGTVSPSTSTSNASGIARTLLTLGPNPGQNTVQAAVAGTSGVSFSAQAVAAPTITSVTPDPLVPGAAATITGTNFSATAGDNTVTFNSTVAQIQTASTTQLTVIVPCETSGTVNITVSRGGVSAQKSHPMNVPNPIALQVGQSSLLPAGAVCREVTGGGRYVIAVGNTSTGSSTTSFRLRGASAPSGPSTANITTASAQRPTFRSSVAQMQELKGRAAHQRVLEKNIDLIRRLGPPPRVSAAAAPSGIAAQLSGQQIAVGDTLQLKIPDLMGNLCTTKETVRARVVHAGARGVILEDVAAPVANQMDSLWRALGQEFETIGWNILTTNFGNPVAYDAQTDGDGKIYMLFSKVINDFEQVAGFVTSGNFYPAGLCPSSNLAEIFYGVVPTDPVRGYDNAHPDNPESWWRFIRSIVVHEVKHLTSYGERFARNGSQSPNIDERWMEEGTAVISEEMYAREIFGYANKANVTFQQSLYCERRPTTNPSWPQCWHKPFIMYGYFAWVYEYMETIESLSPLGPANTDDASYYGSSWSLLRWAADHYGTTEAGFFRALTQEAALKGVRNLEARTNKTFTELLLDWAIALAIDDRPNTPGVQAIHTFPSWNTRDIFAGMNSPSEGLQQVFPVPFPLSPRQLSYGAFNIEVPSLRAGSAAIFELSGTGTKELLHLAGSQLSSPPPTEVRIKIIRVE
jgi:hypothetical protein